MTLLATLITGISAHASAQVRVWTPVIDTVGSAQRVMNPGYTLWQDSTTGWKMSLERTVALTVFDTVLKARRPIPPMISPAQLATQLWRTLLLDDGRVIVSRANPASVDLYDAQGDFVRTIGRRGGGDGLYLAATGLTMYRDTLVVFDGLQGAVRMYTLEGKYVRGFDTGLNGRAPSIAVDPRGLLRIEHETKPRPVDLIALRDSSAAVTQAAMDKAFRAGAVWRWVYYTPLGLRVDSITAPQPLPPKMWIARTVASPNSATTIPGGGTWNAGVMMTSVPYQTTSSITFLSDGSLLSGFTDKFQFLNSRNGRDTIRIFGRTNYNLFPLSRALVDSMIQTQVNAGMPAALFLVMKPEDFPTSFPLWNDITTDEKGYIWVSVGFWARRNHYFQVFSPNGRYLGMVTSRFEKFEGSSWANDHVAVPGYDTDRRPVIHIYKIDRRGM